MCNREDEPVGEPRILFVHSDELLTDSEGHASRRAEFPL